MINAEGFLEDRRNILIDPSNISGVIGVDVSEQSIGEEKFKGFDLNVAWNNRHGDFEYGLYANGGWLFSKVVDDGQAYQMYDYLYRNGDQQQPPADLRRRQAR